MVKAELTATRAKVKNAVAKHFIVNSIKEGPVGISEREAAAYLRILVGSSIY